MLVSRPANWPQPVGPLDDDDGVSFSAQAALRERLLDRFRWSDGHADFSAVLADAETVALIGPGLVEPFRDSAITVVVGIEARGFVLAGLAAVSLGVGLVLARKTGAVYPGPKVEVTSEPDWRGRQLRFQIPLVLSSKDRVLLVDDWVETGSQARAVKSALEACGAVLAGVSVLVDDLDDAAKGDLPLIAVVSKTELGSDT